MGSRPASLRVEVVAGRQANELLQQAREALTTSAHTMVVDRVGHLQDVRAIEQLLLKIQELRRTRPRHLGEGTALTAVEADRLHGFLTEAARLGEEVLEQGLCIVWEARNTQRQPYGAAVVALRRLADSIQTLEETLQAGHHSIEGADRVLKRVSDVRGTALQEAEERARGIDR